MTAPDTAASDSQVSEIKRFGRTLGFDRTGIAAVDLAADAAYLDRWLALGRHGEMQYMARHGTKRSRPAELVEGTISVISARMNYLPEALSDAENCLADPARAYIARYALGRDYHKILRQRLARLADRIRELIGDGRFRVFVDSAPVLEKALARDAGLGWIGKHSNLLDRSASSWFLLGEIYTDLPLTPDRPTTGHCGSCTACIDACPTRAIVAPYEVDARRCISYLTIELTGSIPVEFRAAIGNRIFGCDDCQLVCPWNKYAMRTAEEQFLPRHGLATAALTELFGWSEVEWDTRTSGSALRRPGYTGWLRNIAVALGNAPTTPAVVASLNARADDPSPVVREHVAWALGRHDGRARGP
jgi:epoxyqueuosine reductase